MNFQCVIPAVKGAKGYFMSLEERLLAQSEVTRFLFSGAAGGVGVNLQDGFLGNQAGETRGGKK